ncbi:hypothetical protein GCM10028806_52410 [Spirosoma terrae]|uniref:Lipoprotein n=1 Tax=Spirosoma terrae TaxID=1968276 RepID=A0A6L9LAS7_9BACT|nr:hypothetical protein [Spirosoma terrae]NDU96597.1 hypothetical protein [Spirosoma terrae]
MRVLLLFLLTFAFSCQKDSPEGLGPIRTEPAFIYENSVPTDGCEEHVRLDIPDSTATAVSYKPTASSLPILQKALADIQPNPTTFERAVTIRFAETGRQVDLMCGWGTRQQMNEIEIISISRR